MNYKLLIKPDLIINLPEQDAYVFFVSWLPVGGFTLGQRRILINTKYKEQIPLLKHELKHIYQIRKTGTFKWYFKYIFSRQFRLEQEVEAYKESIKWGANRYDCANSLQSMYWLGIDIDQAYNLLTKEENENI